MTGHRAFPSVVVFGAAAVALAGPFSGGLSAQGQASPRGAPRQSTAAPSGPEVAILQALQTNPVTAPYRFAVAAVGRQYALSGKVGTKRVHDVAIQTMIALGYPVRDDLTIDTREVYRTDSPATSGTSPAGVRPAIRGIYPYVYPPPLFGRIDEPFLGLEPPLVSYPPWFGAVAAREPIDLSALNPPGQVAAAPATEMTDPGGNNAPNPNPNPNAIEMTLDSRGVAVLRGQVPTLADRVAVGQKIAGTPGITEVVNLLQVVGASRPAEDRRPISDTPPPPPVPYVRPAHGGPAAGVPDRPPAPQPARTIHDAPAGERAIAVDGDPTARRVSEALARRPNQAGALPRVSGRDGTVTLSGHVPSAYEAMLAFRAAQQTPGVREVVDRMEFALPDGDGANPLRDKGRPEDVEPYLLAQIRRQVGDLAHVEQVRLRGDTLEVRGTVSRGDDTPRVEATLRSIPLLRGFRLEPAFAAE